MESTMPGMLSARFLTVFPGRFPTKAVFCAMQTDCLSQLLYRERLRPKHSESIMPDRLRVCLSTTEFTDLSATATALFPQSTSPAHRTLGLGASMIRGRLW